MELRKPVVKLGPIALAATSPIVWQLRSGVHPYQTVVHVHKDQADNMNSLRGKPQTLSITDGEGKEWKIEKVYVLHEVPSDSPHRNSYVISDVRWLWPYRLIAREFNVTKRTGTRFTPEGQTNAPVEILVTVDEYQYRSHTLRDGKRWTAKQAVEHVLELLTDKKRETDPEEQGQQNNQNQQGGQSQQGDPEPPPFSIDSFPIEGDNEDGQYTLQNVTLRDQGDAALARLLGMIPGADVYVRLDGTIVVFDGTDLQAADDKLKEVKKAITWDGEYPREIKRNIIRPRGVRVHYQREVELLLAFQDEWELTTAQQSRNAPWLENVIPTTDPVTVMSLYDPETNTIKQDVQVRQGTYVRVQDWLQAMDKIKPQGSAPWTWDTVKRHWVTGTLDQVWNGGGKFDLDEQGNVSMRIQALKQHFRQTFRINRRYVERFRDIRAVRVGLLDPVTGARAPAAVWGQACVLPSMKGYRLTAQDLTRAAVYRNVDYRPQGEATVLTTPPGPVEVQIVDPELGILHLRWIESPYGIDAQWYPCHLVAENGAITSVTRDLTEQRRLPVARGAIAEGGTNGIYLRSSFKFLLMLTVVPDGPNTTKQLHQVSVTPVEIEEVFRTEFRLQGGSGPFLDVFIPPGEATARLALTDPRKHDATVERLLGLNEDDIAKQGIPHGEQVDGYTVINEDVELKSHARAVAAEAWAHYSDAHQGRVATKLDDQFGLVGNMATATISVAAAPSGKIMAMYEFPGQQRPISRFSLLSETARRVILGTLPYS